MHKIYEDQSSEVVLLVDISNAFNSINRNAFIHNITVICPPPAKFVRNVYANTRLFIRGGGEIKSTEGKRQGDHVGMAIYPIAIAFVVLSSR